MIIKFHLNGQTLKINTDPHTKVSALLGDSLHSIHQHCANKRCGNCMIIMNNELVLTCLLKAFDLQSAHLWTYEGISQNEEFADIRRGLESASLCPSCTPARALVVESLLESNLRPSNERIHNAVHAVRCGCTSTVRISKAMRECAQLRERRLKP